MSSTLTQVTARPESADQAVGSQPIANQPIGSQAVATQAIANQAGTRPTPGSTPKAHPAAPSPSASSKLAPSVAWRSWPLVDDGLQHWPVLAWPLAIAAIIGLLFNSLAMMVLALGVQWLALWRLWLPTDYEMNDRGIRQTVLGWSTRIRWSTLRRCQILSDGILLSADAEPGPFAGWRGRFIPWNENRAEVLAAVNRLAGYPTAATAPESTTATRIAPE